MLTIAFIKRKLIATEWSQKMHLSVLLSIKIMISLAFNSLCLFTIFCKTHTTSTQIHQSSQEFRILLKQEMFSWESHKIKHSWCSQACKAWASNGLLWISVRTCNPSRHSITQYFRFWGQETSLPGCAARKENKSLQLAIVEEIIEGPNAPVFTVWIRSEIRVVANDITHEHMQSKIKC